MKINFIPFVNQYEYINNPNQIEYFCPEEKRFFDTLHVCCDTRSNFLRSGNSISILTTVKNRRIEFEKMIERTHQIDKMSRPTIEHIVVDSNLSAFRLKSVIENSTVHTIYLNEIDNGIYFGMNKCLELFHGKYFNFLNSDDWIMFDDLECEVAILNFSKFDFLHGDTYIYFENQPPKLFESFVNSNHRSLANFSRFHHGSVLVNRNVLDSVGYFPTHLHIGGFKINLNFANDYAWFLRAQLSFDFKGIRYNNKILHMSGIGASISNSKRSIFEAGLIAFNFAERKKFRVAVLWIGRFISSYFDLYDSFLYRFYKKLIILKFI